MQTELISKPAPKEIEELRALLAVRGWQTRSQISRDTGWSERKIRDVCESMGAEVAICAVHSAAQKVGMAAGPDSKAAVAKDRASTYLAAHGVK